MVPGCQVESGPVHEEKRLELQYLCNPERSQGSGRVLSPLGDLQHLRPCPSERPARNPLHVIGAQVGVPLGHLEILVEELGGRVDEIGCLRHLGP